MLLLAGGVGTTGGGLSTGDISKDDFNYQIKSAQPWVKVTPSSGRVDKQVRAGVSIDVAQAEMDAITARLRALHPQIYPPRGGLTFDIVPLQEQVVGDVRHSIVVLGGAVALVLAIACANVNPLRATLATIARLLPSLEQP